MVPKFILVIAAHNQNLIFLKKTPISENINEQKFQHNPKKYRLLYLPAAATSSNPTKPKMPSQISP